MSREAASRRKILCVFPRYAPSFGTFEHAYKLFPDVRAFMPPQGLLTIAAYLPPEWEVRFVDENLAPAAEPDLRWADAVLVSGMHVQRDFIDDINRRAQRAGAITVLGGPSVSASPEYYPDVDALHLGELGDATDRLIRWLASGERPARQLVFRTEKRLDLREFPLPAYQRLDLEHYFLGSIQYSSGCPYLCEFCDIPVLYGRTPRIKDPARICEELDTLLAAGLRGAVYFVDDNFIANKKAAKELLPPLIRWQQRNGYPLRFACEATLNLAKSTDLLRMMREAAFHTVFIGIETPEEEALLAMRKKQNLSAPLLESIRTLNGFGLEVVSGIIMGLDTDTPGTGERILEFIDASQIPLLTINMLYALPRTPLYERLERDGRLVDDRASGRVSNVDFLLPYEQVVGMWHRTITTAYRPERLFQRFRHQTEHTFPNRHPARPKASFEMVKYGLELLARVLWHSGLEAPWRREFWNLCWPLLRQGRIEEVIHIGIVTYHLLSFTREIEAGRWEACFYADPNAPRIERVA